MGRGFLAHFFAGLWFDAAGGDGGAAQRHMAAAVAVAPAYGRQEGVLEALALRMALDLAFEAPPPRAGAVCEEADPAADPPWEPPTSA